MAVTSDLFIKHVIQHCKIISILKVKINVEKGTSCLFLFACILNSEFNCGNVIVTSYRVCWCYRLASKLIYEFYLSINFSKTVPKAKIFRVTHVPRLHSLNSKMQSGAQADRSSAEAGESHRCLKGSSTYSSTGNKAPKSCWFWWAPGIETLLLMFTYILSEINVSIFSYSLAMPPTGKWFSISWETRSLSLGPLLWLLLSIYVQKQFCC